MFWLIFTEQNHQNFRKFYSSAEVLFPFCGLLVVFLLQTNLQFNLMGSAFSTASNNSLSQYKHKTTILSTCVLSCGLNQGILHRQAYAFVFYVVMGIHSRDSFSKNTRHLCKNLDHEFTLCFSSRCDTTEKLRNSLDCLRSLLNEPTNFKLIYRYAFDFARVSTAEC